MGISHLKIKHVKDIRYSLLQNELEVNIKSFFDYALLNAGNWNDVRVSSSGAYGGNFSTLHLSKDPLYTEGQVWETPRTDLVYETGIVFNGSSPIAISGVYINNSFYPANDPTYGHTVDYTNGRVIFDTAISTTDTVSMEYSYRNIQVQIADDSPMWKQLQYDSLRVDDSQISDPDKGEWAKPAISRSQTPTIIIEAVSRGNSLGYELGNISQRKFRDVVFTCVAEDRFWRNQLVDIVDFLDDQTIFMYNTNEVANSGAFTLNYDGTINPSGVQYDKLVDDRSNNGYRWRELRFTNCRPFEANNRNPRLFTGGVRCTTEVIYGSV